MKKLVVFSLGVLTLAACTEGPTGPSPSPESAAFDHTAIWQAGTGKAWHDYHQPAVAPTSGATSIQLDIAWTDDRVSVVTAGDPDFYAFEIRWSIDGVTWSEADVRDFSDPLDGAVSYLIEGLEENTSYLIEVKGLAKKGTGPATETHHTAVASLSASTGGAVYTVVFSSVPGNGLITDDLDGNTSSVTGLNRNAATWGEIQFRIRLNNVDLTTCDFTTVTALTTFNFSTPSPQTDDHLSSTTCVDGLYTMDIDNKAKIGGNKYSSAGTITVSHDETAVENIVDYTSN
jgi:hypothetical protein